MRSRKQSSAQAPCQTGRTQDGQVTFDALIQQLREAFASNDWCSVHQQLLVCARDFQPDQRAAMLEAEVLLGKDPAKSRVALLLGNLSFEQDALDAALRLAVREGGIHNIAALLVAGADPTNKGWVHLPPDQIAVLVDAFECALAANTQPALAALDAWRSHQQLSADGRRARSEPQGDCADAPAKTRPPTSRL